MQKTTRPPHHPHDLLFKAVFKQPDNVREVLTCIAPSELLDVLALDSLRLADASFVDEALAEHLADVVLFCDTKADSPVMVPFILEHKSYVPSHPPLQIMQYQLKVWQRQTGGKGQQPTPIVPIIFYHGKESWRVRQWPAYLAGWDPVFAPYTPTGGYVFIDLSELPDETIKRFRSGFLVTSLLLMKHRWDGKLLLENLTEFFSFVEYDEATDEDNRSMHIKFALRYLQGLKALEWEAVRGKIKPLKMSYQEFDIYEDARMEGREEKTYFVVYKMLKQNLTAEQVSDFVGLTIEEVLKIKQQLTHEPTVLQQVSAGKMSVNEIAAQLEIPVHLVNAIKNSNMKPGA